MARASLVSVIFFAAVCSAFQSGTLPPSSRVRASSSSQSRVLLADKGEDGNFFGALAKLNPFKPKEEDTALAKRQKEVDQSVDKLLEGSGLMGAMLAPLMKGLGGAMAEAFAEQKKDVDEVLDALDRALQRDSRVSSALGGSVSAGSPVSQAAFTQVINGDARKVVTLIVPVSGAGGVGTAQVQASLSAQGIIQEMEVAFDGPGIGRISISDSGFAGGDGDVIDV
mmetsp:Transcript_16979/g.45765  ORF Transcript_16979/g.45765 Transcript_16979/m.45765 type:complete len:225 (-) Transcript_16979:238-912(-)